MGFHAVRDLSDPENNEYPTDRSIEVWYWWNRIRFETESTSYHSKYKPVIESTYSRETWIIEYFAIFLSTTF